MTTRHAFIWISIAAIASTHQKHTQTTQTTVEQALVKNQHRERCPIGIWQLTAWAFFLMSTAISSD